MKVITKRVMSYMGFVLMVVMFSIYVSASGGEYLTSAPTISTGSTVYSTLAANKTEYFKFYLSADSVICLNAITGDHYQYVSFRFRDSNGNYASGSSNPYFSTSDNENFGYQRLYRCVGLNKGWYYVEVTSSSRTTSYSFTISIDKSTSSSLKIAAYNNNYLSFAQPMSIGNTCYGVASSLNEQYYRFTLSSNTTVRFSTTVMDSNFGSVCYSLYNSAGSRISYNYVYYGTSETEAFSLSAGTYYLGVDCGSYSAGARYQIVTSANINGFSNKDGAWKYYRNGNVATGYTGIVQGTINGTSGWFYVKNGVYKNVNGIAQKADGSDSRWFYVRNGVHYQANGIAQKADGSDSRWFLVKNGVYTKTNGIAQKADGSDTRWFLVKNGVYTRTNGIAQKAYGSDTRWFLVKNGVYTRATGIAQKAYGSDARWFYVENGVYTRATGIARKAYGSDTRWFYVENGVYTRKNTVAPKADGSDWRWFYVRDGVYTRYTGYVTINGYSYYINAGVY